jgi:phage pi2 protein 07
LCSTPYAVQLVIILVLKQGVKELIDEDMKWWNLNMIQEIFNADEAARIYSLALSPTNKKTN